MINTGLTEEQVFDSFIDASPTLLKPKPKDLNLNDQPMEIIVNFLDIWSSDNKDEGQINLWEAKGKKKIPSVEEVKKKEAEV